MSGPRALLMVLGERTSLRGTAYMSGPFDKARMVAFRGEVPDRLGNPNWNLPMVEPDERRSDGGREARR